MEQLKHYLFIDIETVPVVENFEALSEGMQEQWQKKAKFIKSPTAEIADPALLFAEKAGIYSEFAKVVCIGMGCLVEKDKEWKLLLKSIASVDENLLLKDFSTALTRFTDSVHHLIFCGHNIKEFDIPFLCRRMIIHGIPLPLPMQLTGKKPWDIPHVDTMELWRFGDYKHFTSLALLAEVLDIPTPKDDIDGSMVGHVYWKEGNLQRIADYCLKDVLTTAKVFLRLKSRTDINPEPVFVQEVGVDQ